MPDQKTNPPGDSGVRAEEDAPRLRDKLDELQMTERAVRNGWAIPPEEKRKIVEQMTALATDPKTRPRSRSIAVRVLAQLDSLDLRDRHHVERLEANAGIVRLRMQRAEEGLPNDSMAIITAPVEELPLPAWLREAKKRVLEPGEN